MKALIEHIRTDTNAVYHAYFGSAAFGLACILATLGYVSWWLVPFFSLAMGIAIEVKQRLERSAGMQNTWRESGLDAWGTWWFFMYFIFKKQK